MKVISLSSLINATDEEGKVCNYLSSFLCSNNKHVESFLHKKAINSEKRNFNRTSLIIDEDENILGYFTLMVKSFNFDNNISKTTRKSLANNKNASHFNSILIAHLGRPDSFKDELSGSTIVNTILEKCELVYDLTALQTISVEYDPNPKLIQFYRNNQFKLLQTNLTGNELSFLKLS